MMICETCGAPVHHGGAPMCVPCAERLWSESYQQARAQAKVLLPLVLANTAGPGEAVLALLMLARRIHEAQPGLFPFEFYVAACTDGAEPWRWPDKA